MDIIERFNSGMTVQQIAQELSLARQTVYNVLHRNGVIVDTRAKKADVVLELFFRGYSVRAIHRETGYHSQTISKILRSRNLEPVNKGGRPKR